jgi:hypothetical protein
VLAAPRVPTTLSARPTLHPPALLSDRIQVLNVRSLPSRGLFTGIWQLSTSTARDDRYLHIAPLRAPRSNTYRRPASPVPRADHAPEEGCGTESGAHRARAIRAECEKPGEFVDRSSVIGRAREEPGVGAVHRRDVATTSPPNIGNRHVAHRRPRGGRSCPWGGRHRGRVIGGRPVRRTILRPAGRGARRSAVHDRRTRSRSRPNGCAASFLNICGRRSRKVARPNEQLSGSVRDGRWARGSSRTPASL